MRTIPNYQEEVEKMMFKEFERKFNKIKVQLYLRSPRVALVLMKLNMVYQPNLETDSTDGINLYHNLISSSKHDMAYILVHIALHILHGHLWNDAECVNESIEQKTRFILKKTFGEHFQFDKTRTCHDYDSHSMWHNHVDAESLQELKDFVAQLQGDNMFEQNILNYDFIKILKAHEEYSLEDIINGTATEYPTDKNTLFHIAYDISNRSDYTKEQMVNILKYLTTWDMDFASFCISQLILGKQNRQTILFQKEWVDFSKIYVRYIY